MRPTKGETMRYLVMGLLAVVIGSTGAFAQQQKPKQAKAVETQAQCEARQQQIRDPVSGIRIQAGDAGRFCNRQRSRR